MGQFSWMSVHDITLPILECEAAAVLIPKEFGGGFLFENHMTDTVNLMAEMHMNLLLNGIHRTNL